MKEQCIIENNDTREIAHLSKLINMIEDVVDDAECEDVLVARESLTHDATEIIIKPVGCKYDPMDSIEIYSKHWELENVTIDAGDLGFRELYHIVVKKYVSTLHYLMKSYLPKSIRTGDEYYLAVLYDGRAVLLEGEGYRVTLPYIRHCVSAHTHPIPLSTPSIADLRTIMSVLLNRGIMHCIEAASSATIFYRTAPLTEEELFILRRIERLNDPCEGVRIISSSKRISIITL